MQRALCIQVCRGELDRGVSRPDVSPMKCVDVIMRRLWVRSCKCPLVTSKIVFRSLTLRISWVDGKRTKGWHCRQHQGPVWQRSAKEAITGRKRDRMFGSWEETKGQTSQTYGSRNGATTTTTTAQPDFWPSAYPFCKLQLGRVMNEGHCLVLGREATISTGGKPTPRHADRTRRHLVPDLPTGF